MISARRLALIAANVLLTGAAYAAWTRDAPSEEPTVATASTRRPHQDRASPAIEDEQRVGDAKPLFRIRHSEPVASAEPSPPPSPMAPNFRLAGVVWSEAGKVAIVQMAEDGANRRLRVGESVGGWTLRSLTARTALVEAAGNEVELALQPPNVQ